VHFADLDVAGVLDDGKQLELLDKVRRQIVIFLQDQPVGPVKTRSDLVRVPLRIRVVVFAGGPEADAGLAEQAVDIGKEGHSALRPVVDELEPMRNIGILGMLLHKLQHEVPLHLRLCDSLGQHRASI
jgi:hypothetical protein